MPLTSTEDLLEKIKLKNLSIDVSINKIVLDECAPWYYSENTGEICNESHTFFQITGIQKKKNNKIVLEQPIILQNEIGYLGIIRKRIQNEMHYLMQYKTEPGNINKIQVSPTIQATKSNFTQKHGGRKPAYLDYFVNASKYKIIVDQIQSEQSSRFLGKRNRNIIIELNENEDIEVLPSHDWMTLKQIKELMRHDNLVNMDTRTVLSCIPLSSGRYTNEELSEIEKKFSDKELFRSVFRGDAKNVIPEIYQYINNYKMFDESQIQTVPLFSLNNWRMKNDEFICVEPYSFKVVFCDIEIDGREVKHWCQPLVEATGIATFGMFTCVDNGVRKFLVKCRSEVGCFDKIEIGPCIQREYISSEPENDVDKLFYKKLQNNEGVLFNVLLSEEGGRFYQEQNKNVIIEIDKSEITLPDGYFWCDYKTLNTLVQVNNTLNIQLRNLLSVLEF